MRSARPAQIDDPYDAHAAEVVALRILGGASQSAAGLHRRLVRHGFSDDAAREAVERCRDLRYVDDTTLALSIAGRHRRANHGRARVVADLRARGVDADAIEQATATLRDGEQDAAVAAAKHLSARHHGDLDSAALRRIGAALQRRGFAGDVIVRALRAIE